jgi:hypothetical protein
LTTKPARSPARIGVLPSAAANASARATASSAVPERDDDLDQLHDRHRGEEVQPEDVLGAAGRRGQVRDRDRRGVRRQQRAGLHRRVERLEHAALHREVLDDRLDDEVRVGEVAQVARPCHTALQGAGVGGLELAAGHGAFHRGGDALARALQRRGLGLVDVHGDAGAGDRLGDARAHEPAAHDPDLANLGHAAAD